MRVHRSIQLLTLLPLLAGFAACHSSDSGASAQADSAAGTALAADPAPAPAAAPAAAPTPAPTTVGVKIDVHWDSGPLDLSYHNARVALDAQHAREVAKPRADESSNQRTRRQEDENKALEERYSKGKSSHARVLPPEER